jgi:hypothetical protein
MPRRREVRIVAAIPIVDCESGVEYQSSDLSTDGLFVLGVSDWQVGSTRALKILHAKAELSLLGRVVRADDDGAAVSLVSPSAEAVDQIIRLMHSLLSEQVAPIGDQRHGRRIKASGAVAWTHEDTEYLSTLAEISSHGAVLECRTPPVCCATITVALAGAGEEAGNVHCRAAVVRYVKGGFAVSFDHPSRGFRLALTKNYLSPSPRR